MKDIEIINIDFTGNNPAYRQSEKFKQADIPTPFVIPDQTPFYTRNFVLKGNGKPLDRGVHYVFEDYLEDLELLTGKTVCVTIRLLNKALEDFQEFSIDYNKVGDPMVSRKYLLDSAEKIVNNDTKVDWNDQVFGKPDTYPPSFHIHDVREKDELVGFSDLVVLFKQFRGQQVKHGLDIWNRLLKIREATYNDLERIYKERWDQLFTHIQDANVPHPMTKADIGLGNHPNYATATEQEDRDGKRSDVLSTPRGLIAALEEFDADSDGYLRQGSLPFSYYGTGIYIPPPISGSFEGLGTNTGGSALCVESNGWTVALTRGYDSKVRQLYYYYNRNVYDTRNENFIFSGFTYQSPVMEANGHTPNHILSGSDGRILVIGDKEAGAYYIGLGNGTLDAKSHQLMRIDLESLRDSQGTYMWSPDMAYVMMIGDYVYIVGQVHGWAPNIPEDQRFGLNHWRRRVFFRAPVSALYGVGGGTVSFTRQLMNFQNSEGEWAYNQEWVDLARNVTEKDGNGKLILKRCVIGYDVPPTSASLGNPWRCQFFNMQNPNNKNQATLRVCHNTRFEYFGDAQVSGDWWFCLPYTFDVTTNTMTLDSRFFHISRNFLKNSSETIPPGRDGREWFNGAISGLCAGHAEIAAAFIPRLGYTAMRTSVYNLPYNAYFGFMGYNPNASGYKGDMSDWDIFNQTLVGLGENGYYTRNVPLDSPFGFTTKPCIQTDLWEYNGKQQSLPIEIFRSLDRGGVKALWGRQSKDNYDYNPGTMFNFKYINATVIGRPPSTMFMKGIAENLNQNFSGRLPAVGTNSKDKHGTQYGIVNIASHHYNADWDFHLITGGLYYADVSGDKVNVQESEKGFYLSLLGKHTADTTNGILKIEKIPTESVYITRAVWIGMMKTMLGSRFNEITNDKGQGVGGDWILTIYVSSKPGGGVIPSVAFLTYHAYSEPDKTLGVLMTFNWNQVGTRPGGEKIIGITNQKFPDPEYGPGGKVFTLTYNYTQNGAWPDNDISYGSECLNPTFFIEFTNADNYEFWIHNGINTAVPYNASSSCVKMTVQNGASVYTNMKAAGMYNGAGLSAHQQLVTGYGICTPSNASLSGGAALYTSGGRIPNGQLCLMQAVFIEGNWTLFVNSDMTAVFNGTEKNIPKTNYDLSELGIDQKNKTFYLYAMSGKTLGYYDLTLSERTASPYHLLVATIKTNSFGIEQIQIEQRFAISGFTIGTNRNGGIVPASTGTVSDAGAFKTVGYADLFDQSKYN